MHVEPPLPNPLPDDAGGPSFMFADSFFRRRFGSTAGAAWNTVGKTVSGGLANTLVGVLPPDCIHPS